MSTYLRASLHALLLAAAFALPACSSLRSANSRQLLDEQGGDTLWVVSHPLVFARDRTDVAAFARDYATLVALEIDHSGDYADYLLLYRWSTVDRRMSAPPDARSGELRILAEGRVLDLKPLAEIPVSLASGHEFHVPAHSEMVAHAYRVDPELLRFLAASDTLTVQMPQERLETPFPLWEDGRPALREFLERPVHP
jgi:hypothetical protein